MYLFQLRSNLFHSDNDDNVNNNIFASYLWCNYFLYFSVSMFTTTTLHFINKIYCIEASVISGMSGINIMHVIQDVLLGVVIRQHYQ